MTALIGRATACLGAGTRNPERLGSAIATLAVVRIVEERRLGDGANNGQERHVRLNAPFPVIDATSAGDAVGALAGRKALRSSVIATATATVSVTETVADTATVIGHGHRPRARIVVRASRPQDGVAGVQRDGVGTRITGLLTRIRLDGGMDRGSGDVVAPAPPPAVGRFGGGVRFG